jgi:pilus assembly protein Flp/PilA
MAGNQPILQGGTPLFDTIRSRVYALLVRTRAEQGQALVEYALIISLIAVVAIGALELTGTNVTSILSDIAGDL